MELTLFIIVGAIAVVAAAMMLVSENAVHSALFLIVNFACIAFFFLMLDAPFLALVQITVYAGAIMVLFLFVIMLLGAERVFPGEQGRLRWMMPVAVVLALVFLAVASLAIVRGDVALTAREPFEPRVRVVNAASMLDGVDVYLNGTPAAEGLAFGEATDFQVVESGRYVVALYEAGADPDEAEPLDQREVDLDAGEVVSLTSIGAAGQPSLVFATEDVSRPAPSELRVQVVNALPDRTPVDVRDVTQGELLFADLGYGEVMPSIAIREGTRSIGVFPAGDSNTHLALLDNKELEAGKSVLWVFTARQLSGNAWENRVIELEAEALASFGSPSHVGQLLFSRYVLPFEMVALVLLVAMIGALVLTHEVTERREVSRRLANPSGVLAQPAQPITRESGK